MLLFFFIIIFFTYEIIFLNHNLKLYIASIKNLNIFIVENGIESKINIYVVKVINFSNYEEINNKEIRTKN